MKEDAAFSEEQEDCTLDVALFVIGTLPPDQANAVEQRLRSGCPFCLAEAQQYAVIAEQLALSVVPVKPPEDLRQRLLNRLQLQDTSAENVLHRKVVRGKDAPWINMAIPGVEMRPLIGEKTFLLRLQPGAVFPKHDHPHAEQCYVLEGSITDSDGLTLHAGDFVVMARGSNHSPISSANGCTLFIAYAD
jgi:hypothetical protein